MQQRGALAQARRSAPRQALLVVFQQLLLYPACRQRGIWRVRPGASPECPHFTSRSCLVMEVSHKNNRPKYMNIDARSAGLPSFSFALQSPRSCSSCAPYQLRSATGIAVSARWHFQSYAWAHVRAAELSQGPVVLTFSIARDGLDLGFETQDALQGARVRSVRVCLKSLLY